MEHPVIGRPEGLGGLDIRCGAPYVVAGVAVAVERAGFQVDARYPVKLLIDAPIGYALATLGALNDSGALALVTTVNYCPEYVEDLWDCEPRALLAGGSLTERLPDVVARIERGERFRLAPGCPTRLTPRERRILRAVAHGWGNDQIARQLGVAPSTVMNALTRVYRKVGVESRAEALLYYWGIWPMAASGS